MMMTLGFFVFSVSTASYQQLQRTTTWRKVKTDLVGRRPVYQFLGHGEDTINLDGTLYPELTGGRAALDLLRVMGESGKASPLIEGSGRIYGFWSIDSISETDTVFFPDGSPKKVEFSVALTRVDDKKLDLLSMGINAGLGALTGAAAGPLNKVRRKVSF